MFAVPRPAGLVARWCRAPAHESLAMCSKNRYSFAGAMTLGAVPAFLAYPNFKIEPSKYRSGLAGVTASFIGKGCRN